MYIDYILCIVLTNSHTIIIVAHMIYYIIFHPLDNEYMYIHNNTWDGKKERKKDTWGKWNELPQVGFEPTTLDRCSYQLSYQGSPAGSVQIKHLIQVHICTQTFMLQSDKASLQCILILLAKHCKYYITITRNGFYYYHL